MTLPALTSIPEIESRLKTIFPPGVDARRNLVGRRTARVVYVMLYGGMIEGAGRMLRPAHVYLFTDEQSLKTADEERSQWFHGSHKQGFRPTGRRWYADTTREPIRDETLRFGLVRVGAVGKAEGIATTSSSGVYFLRQDFASLFDPRLDGDPLTVAVARWQQRHLTVAARARMTLLAAKATKADGQILVSCPDGSVAKLSPGPSSVIAKAVIEGFASFFIPNPALIWLSESATKVRFRDQVLAEALKLNIDQAKVLPDIILANVGQTGSDTYLVFIEVVATDGPVDDERRQQLTQYVEASGFPIDQVYFGTAFKDRSDAGRPQI